MVEGGLGGSWGCALWEMVRGEGRIANTNYHKSTISIWSGWTWKGIGGSEGAVLK